MDKANPTNGNVLLIVIKIGYKDVCEIYIRIITNNGTRIKYEIKNTAL